MFLRARTKEQVDERKMEIIKAMDDLYATKELSEIYLKDIAARTSIGRTAIYSYYSRKEEILLDCLYYHFIDLDDGLQKLLNKEKEEDLPDALTALLCKNVAILKIMSTNLEELERKTTVERLVVLKTELKRFQTLFMELLSKNYPDADKEDIRYVLYTFIALLYGYYPLANPIDVQREAMERTGTTINADMETLIRKSLSFLLRNLR